MLVKDGKVSRYDIVNDIVNKLLELVLLLPVAAASSVERIFSIMNFIKKQAKKQDGAEIFKWLLGHIH